MSIDYAIELPVCQCNKCGYTWHPRKKQRPGVCPKCRDPKWDYQRAEDGKLVK